MQPTSAKRPRNKSDSQTRVDSGLAAHASERCAMLVAGYLQFGSHLGAVQHQRTAPGGDARFSECGTVFGTIIQWNGINPNFHAEGQSEVVLVRYQAVDILWTFSQFCEGFAMVTHLARSNLHTLLHADDVARTFVPLEVPQYVFCYRDRLAKACNEGARPACNACKTRHHAFGRRSLLWQDVGVTLYVLSMGCGPSTSSGEYNK